MRSQIKRYSKTTKAHNKLTSLIILTQRQGNTATQRLDLKRWRATRLFLQNCYCSVLSPLHLTVTQIGAELRA